MARASKKRVWQAAKPSILLFDQQGPPHGYNQNKNDQLPVLEVALKY